MNTLKKFFSEFLFLLCIIINFLFFYLIPLTYQIDYSFKISTVIFSDKYNPAYANFELSPFQTAQIFKSVASYNIAKKYLAKKYSLDHSNFITKGLDLGGSLDISLKTIKLIPSTDIELFGKIIRQELKNAALNTLKKSNKSIQARGDYLLISIAERNNENLKKKAPLLLMFMMLILYILTKARLMKFIFG